MINKNNSSLVSVIIPVLNSAAFLRDAIDSILSQTHNNLELIIIYDNSYDTSLDIIKEYCSLDSRVSYINGDNSGISGALNIGIKISNGTFIARMDADDLSEANRIEDQLEHMEKNNLDICGGHNLLMDRAGKINGISIVPLNQYACTLSLTFNVPFVHSSVMLRTSFLHDYDLLYGQSIYKTSEDYDLWIRMHDHGATFGSIDKVILKYRVLDNSLSRNNPLMLIDSNELAKKFYDNHYDSCLKGLDTISKSGNSNEQSLVVRFIWRSLYRKLNLSALRYLKPIGYKIIIHTIISDLSLIITKLLNLRR